MDRKTLAAVLDAQGNEVTEYVIYTRLAERTSDPHNRKILERIARDELRHFEMWEKISGRKIPPNRLRVWWYMLISRLFGLSFGLKLMEKGEALARDVYGTLQQSVPDLGDLIRDEQRHEEDILGMLEEERLEYAGSIVLGLNDALVELTGALAGLTLALQNGRVIAIIGLITGIAASMSMAASGYLSSREEKGKEGAKSPLKSALYTGIAYIVTVALLILPYIVVPNIYAALATMVGVAILVIAGYTFYITTAKGLGFWRRFSEMALISLAVSVISFGIGWVIRGIFGADL
jgi:VIT1/CCC1 family predicted Fe2+/Mn2+ transporter